MRDMFRCMYFGCSDVMVENKIESGRHAYTLAATEEERKKESSIHDEKWTNWVNGPRILRYICAMYCIWINSIIHKQVYKCTKVKHWTWICLMFYATINVVQIEYSIRFYTCNANMMCDCMKCCFQFFMCEWV